MKKLLSFFGDPNIGLYGKACDKIALLGRFLKGSVKSFFDTPTEFVTIANTDFVGIFLAFNSNGVVVPKIATDKEIEKLKKLFENNIALIKGKYTALGNLILTNDKGCILSDLIPKEDMKKISDVLGVECEYSSIAGSRIVGASAVVTNKGCLAHRDLKEDEAEMLSSVLKVPVDIGTINFGSPFIASGIIANSKHAWIGENTSGPELDRIIRTLDI